MDLETIVQSEVSQKEKSIYILLHIFGIKKNGIHDTICKVDIETQT